MRFSVLLPTHNRGDVVGYAMESVLGQSVGDFELLVVGDGCTDGTAEVVKGFVERDKRVRWFDLPKGKGFGYGNRNVGLREARGELIAYMAHDDLWMGDHLEKLGGVMSGRGGGLEWGYSRPMWVVPRGKIVPGSFHLGNAETMRRFLGRERNGIPAACVVHRRECLEKYGYWDEKVERNGDWELWVRMLKGGAKMGFCGESTCLHFRAAWRKGEKDWMDVERVWELFHGVEGFMPRELKVEVAEGMTEQEAVWRAMKSGGSEWVRGVRRGVVEAMDLRIGENDELIARLMKDERGLEVSGLMEGLGRVKVAWRPGVLLRGWIGVNNRLRRWMRGREGG